ncbi:MAG: YolD-like family protein [Firmicutes bacterium]|nr:YolD-like family protein [[Eubacterium] siraeum]MCM1489122.1 YolD-like family protein [Bacillota bacterium]
MDKDRYDDIINLPRHVSPTRHPMSNRDRAAQFSPFAALTGYDSHVREAARLTYSKRELTEEEKQEIEQRLQFLSGCGDSPIVEVTYFKPDQRKSGGSYETVTAEFKKVDPFELKLVFKSGEEIPLEDIYSIESDALYFLDSLKEL